MAKPILSVPIGLFLAFVCDVLKKPMNGSLIDDVALVTFTTAASCDVGFWFERDRLSKTLLCQDNVLWNDTVTHCEGMTLNEQNVSSC